MERTLVVVKPDGVQRRLVGEVLARLERKGLRLAGLKLTRVTPALAEKMYAEHKGKDFYPPLVDFITASPVVAIVAEGRRAVAIVRTLLGPTNGPEAPGGTIRGDFGMSRRHNLVHGSDSPASAEREIAILFAKDELHDYQIADETWVYER
ncbi:MAG: nucleoside-diphosphate kinase [Planctomycetota bacterium]|nr:nucleoside-diphosphate kinase [Planctomycetota bacterium]